jgi:2-polyprenyl-3-methyl-5-hydroxy-6-metoxy-1,4-benzoquinol methylase
LDTDLIALRSLERNSLSTFRADGLVRRFDRAWTRRYPGGVWWRRRKAPKRVASRRDDAVDWDAHWREQIAERSPWSTRELDSLAGRLATWVERSGHRTVLYAGCGISLEPRVLAELGLAVTAFDLSPVAVEFARGCALTDEDRPHFYRHGPIPDPRPGSLDYLVGDILDADCCPGPYDIVICRRIVQHFIVAGRGGPVIDALLRRLSDSGLLVITSHFPVIRRDVQGTIYMYLQRAGIEFGVSLPADAPAGRFALCYPTTG